MIKGIVDKLVFATVLIALFQLPLFADHYRQYLAGFEAALRQEVEALHKLANQAGYLSTQALIDTHRASSITSVRLDADNKQALIIKHQDAVQAITLFNSGSLLDKARYMFAPERIDTLQSVSKNFQPGIPLNPEYLLLSALLALAFNLLASSPYHCYCYIKKRRARNNTPHNSPLI